MAGSSGGSTVHSSRLTILTPSNRFGSLRAALSQQFIGPHRCLSRGQTQERRRLVAKLLGDCVCRKPACGFMIGKDT